MHPRLLIVGTVPYNTQSTSRAFDAYFHFWEKENIAQVFSDPKTPVKGHCGSLYQITDYRMLQRWINRRMETGVIYDYENLPDNNDSPDIIDESLVAHKSYRFGARHSPITHLLRKWLWKKKYWCTNQFRTWLDEFNPECVFLSFSNDFFIPRIAFYVAKRFNIPIISSIGDDYYFNIRFSLDPFYWWYKLSYRRLIKRVLSWRGSANYISDKIRDKYNSEFGLNGETVYLTSTVQRKSFSAINTISPLFTYFGNIRMGRNTSLNDIGNVLGQINPKYKLEVYSGEKDPTYYRILQSNPNIIYGGSIPYELVRQKIRDSDVTVIVEGFRKRDIDCSRYSLSTKAADALASGASILSYGSQDCGIIEYMESTHASFVCTSYSTLKDTILQMIDSPVLQKQFYDQQIKMTEEHHSLRKSCSTFESILERVLSSEH